MNLPHTVAVDPGIAWIKDETPAIDVPPDTETRPAPEARWLDKTRRSDVCGAVTPDVVPVGDGAPHVLRADPAPGRPSRWRRRLRQCDHQTPQCAKLDS